MRYALCYDAYLEPESSSRCGTNTTAPVTYNYHRDTLVVYKRVGGVLLIVQKSRKESDGNVVV
jgi:hypothetical protein